MQSKPISSSTPAHDWLRPRLQALLAEAARAGLPAETVVATIIDIVTAPPFDAPATPETPASRALISGDSSAPDPAALEFNSELERSIKRQVEQEEDAGRQPFL